MVKKLMEEGVPLGDITAGDIESALDTYYGNTNWRTGQINTINSTTSGEPAGSEVVPNMVKISQANYDAAATAGTTVSTTFYLIPNV